MRLQGGGTCGRTWIETVIAAEALGTATFASEVIAAGKLGTLVGREKTVEAAPRMYISIGGLKAQAMAA